MSQAEKEQFELPEIDFSTKPIFQTDSWWKQQLNKFVEPLKEMKKRQARYYLQRKKYRQEVKKNMAYQNLGTPQEIRDKLSQAKHDIESHVEYSKSLIDEKNQLKTMLNELKNENEKIIEHAKKQSIELNNLKRSQNNGFKPS